eukprot:TRINITY_DN8245_c0_g1_i1.p1 TRINITY_DN8245_c0_g1~~TRINITY_DN8245_c0_g1_i1.p1  ORF type:complete len:740 (-),score=270.81 TRINITY_DN8245_c0_g1_i1:59-2278(-)
MDSENVEEEPKETMETEPDTEMVKQDEQNDSFKVPSLPFKVPESKGPASEFKEPSLPSSNAIKVPAKEPEENSETSEEIKELEDTLKSASELKTIQTVPLHYLEPSWGGVPDKPYSLEIMKNGTIVDTFKLENKSFYTIGRLPVCDVPFEHPSLSRYHAVLQFKTNPSPEKPVGFYLFDLDSTHGSFHNKKKCFPKTFYRLRVGHMLKFGGSTRTVLLQGPEEDEEEESDLSVTELKALSAEKAKKKAEEEQEKLKKLEELEEAEEGRHQEEMSKGISWGMEDDAVDEEKFPDMQKNPFAELANNEDLYIEDPKKALRNWFEREGYELEFKVEEKGYAQFHCRIDLPVDGEPNFAEAQVKGKKKEAVIQAALEACRVLDRLGVLRPSQQTRMERKVKKWEEDDFYNSDEDEFLDRTGDIEERRKKRMRMAGVGKDTIETYDTLVKKHETAEKEIFEAEGELKKALERRAKAEKKSADNDLDSYLAELKRGAQVDKETVTKLKVKIQNLTAEKDRLVKLINIAKPASMPELKTSAPAKPKPGIMIGKRGSKGLLGKVKSVAKDSFAKPVVVQSEKTKVLEAFLEKDEEVTKKMKLCEDGEDIKPIGYELKKAEPVPKERIGDTSVNKMQKKIGPEIPEHIRDTLSTVEEGDKENSEGKVVGTLDVLKDISAVGQENMDTEEDSEEKRKRGDRGSKRKVKKVEEEPEEYYKIGMDSKYDVWVPPQNQSGDGKTSLNDKLGY